jgi:HPt (histidine-containing phosphotransfer) domain-containing protein
VGSSTPADLRVLAALIGDDPAVVAEVLQLFHTISEQSRLQFQCGIAEERWDAVAFAAHALKSNARSLGALRLGQACADIEAAADNGDAGTLPALLAHFEVELAALRRYLAAAEPVGHAGGKETHP